MTRIALSLALLATVGCVSEQSADLANPAIEEADAVNLLRW